MLKKGDGWCRGLLCCSVTAVTRGGHLDSRSESKRVEVGVLGPAFVICPLVGDPELHALQYDEFFPGATAKRIDKSCTSLKSLARDLASLESEHSVLMLELGR